MGYESLVNEIVFPKPPSANTANRLLRDICGKLPVYSPRLVDKALILYGAGQLGKMAKDFFERVGIPVELVLDANPERYKHDDFWGNTLIANPDDVGKELKQNSLLAVCVATAPYVEIQDSLLKKGWQDLVPFYDIAEAYRDRHPLSNGWFSPILHNNEIRSIERVIGRWSDDISRAHHLQFMAWHSLREEWIFNGAPVSIHERYFTPEVLSVLHTHESFLDVGAHHGEVTIKFLEVVDHQFKAVWVIEPDDINLRKLHAEFDSGQIGDDVNRISILTCAVGETSGRQRFFKGIGYSSQFSELGQSEIKVNTIDELGIIPTFIKIHLEGHELGALTGALHTIQDHRPLVAATTYHNHLGLWQLPAWLMEHLPDYTFFLRLHSWCGTGSVIYCIPNDRTFNRHGYLPYLAS